jgi:ABC-type transport system substrate-binding protein
MHRWLLFIHITLLLISCQSGSQDNAQNVLRFNASNNIYSLDPAMASTQDNIWAVSQIFNGLIELDGDLNPQPSIASNWDISPDLRTYTFHLRNDVYFHDNSAFKDGIGRRLIAADFVYSFQRIMNPKTASPGSWIFNNKLDSIPFSAPNDSTFVINLRQPFSPFLNMLSMPYCFVLPHEGITKYGKSFGRSPIGTGPFKFKQWEEDVKLILRKNSNYFEQGLPHLEALSISFIKSKETAFLEFVQGKLDFFNGIESSFKDEIIDKNGNLGPKLVGKCDLIKGPFLNTEYLACFVDSSMKNSADSFLLNIHFRKALNLAIDRRKMVLFLRNNVGEAADGGFIPKGLPGYQSFGHKLYGYQVDKAKISLDKSNYDGSSHITLTTTKDYLDLCIFVQSQWRKIGVFTDIDVLPGSIMKDAKRNGGLSIFRASWIADYADAENFLSCFYSPNHAPNGPNYTHYSNPIFDELYEKTLQEKNDSLKIEYYEDLDQIMMQDFPIIPLFYDESVWLKSKRVRNLTLNPLKIPKFKWVKMVNN